LLYSPELEFTSERPNESIVIDLFSKLLSSNQVNTVTKQYALMSLTKLSTRLKNGQNEIKEIILSFGTHLNIDLQQRGVEFAQLFSPYNHLRESLLEKMPAMTINRMNGANGNGEVEAPEITVPSEKAVNNGRSNTETLLDLLGSGEDIIMSAPAAVPTNAVPASTSNLLDLLGDIDLSTPAAPVMMSNNNNNNLTSPITISMLDDNENTKISEPVFGLNGGSAPANYDLGLDFLAPSTTTAAKIITAYDKNDLLVQLATVNQSDHMQIIMTTTNNSMDSLEQYLFQAAVPKSFQLQMMSPSGSVLLPGSQITQEMRVKSNSPSAVLRMKLRISYICNGNPILEQCEVSGFEN